jgi:hypothetical protein
MKPGARLLLLYPEPVAALSAAARAQFRHCAIDELTGLKGKFNED